MKSVLPDDITFVLGTFQRFEVDALLMGGQACVLYGGSEFSRDVDFAIHAGEGNFEKMSSALSSLKADTIAVPDFTESALDKGLAVHFRCGIEQAKGLRVDVMTKMRGVDPFPALWERRTVFTFPGAFDIAVLGIRDLVLAKKTQRDKDWPMITRLVEAHYFSNQNELSDQKVLFWLEELRTPELILDIVKRFPALAIEVAENRPLLQLGAVSEIRKALELEEQTEREKDREYWKPLKEELELMRARKRSG